MFKSLRQQLWAITVFATCAIAVLLWTTESATYLYKVAHSNSLTFNDQSQVAHRDLKSLNSEYDESKNNNDANTTREDFEILNNSSDLGAARETATNSSRGTNTAHLNSTSAFPLTGDNGTSPTALPANSTSSSAPLTSTKAAGDDASHLGNGASPSTPPTRARSRARPKSKKRKLDQFKKRAPPFRWCYDNETDDGEISEELPCDLLFEGSKGVHNESYTEAKEQGAMWRSPCEYTDEQIGDMAAENCTVFRQSFNFLDDDTGVQVSKEELQFPLAYVMVAEKWAAQVIRILSAVYRSHNIYCVTYDTHASSAFKKAMNETRRCLGPNVVIPEKHREIYWADISLLRATLDCMRILLSDYDWRYVQILSYNDFPLRTNAEMVQILRQFNGANDVELTPGQPERYTRYHKLSELDNDRVNETRPVPPANIVVYKGSFAATLSREFIRFVFENKHAQDFLEWCVPTWAPEEQFWATLVHNEHINAPGRFPGPCLHYYRHGNTQKPWISRYQIWYSGCEGTWTSGSCVFGVGDLPKLGKRPEFVAHKFYADFEPAAFYCLAKRYYERTFTEEEDWEFPKVPLNMEYYTTLPAVQYQRMTDKEKFACGVMYRQEGS